MSPLALIVRVAPLLAVFALWVGVLGGGVLPVLRAGSFIVAPLCHASDGRARPVLPAHLPDCETCVLCTAPAGHGPAAGMAVPEPRIFGRHRIAQWIRGEAWFHRHDPARGPRGPPASLS